MSSVFDWVSEMRRGARVERWHTYPLDAQTVADHSWNVATIAYALDRTIRREVLLAALFHDVGEHETGDVPAQVKWANPELAATIGALETGYQVAYGICPVNNFALDPYERAVVHVADKLEMLFYCVEQRRRGNLEADLIARRVFEYLDANPPDVAEGTLLAASLPLMLEKIRETYRTLTRGETR